VLLPVMARVILVQAIVYAQTDGLALTAPHNLSVLEYFTTHQLCRREWRVKKLLLVLLHPPQLLN
jgi:hypothetical protein